MGIFEKFAVITGDCKIVGIFSSIDMAEDFIAIYQVNFSSELRYYKIYTDF
jgi:hypothetical protein